MEYVDLFFEALVNYLPRFIGSTLLLIFAWLFGKRITHYWNIRKSKQDLDLQTLKDFQNLYGEFFEIWKLWNYYIRDVGHEKFPKDLWWILIDRICIAEGKCEALLVSISSSKVLSEKEIEHLGLFRQGYQQLRQSIKVNKPLEWNSSENPEYLKFKRLSPIVQSLLTRYSDKTPDKEKAANQLQEITANHWENKWQNLSEKTDAAQKLLS